MNTSNSDPRAFAYLVGTGITHSIAPPMHNSIIESLGYNWNFVAQECNTVGEVMALFRKPNFAGGVVSMPFKTIIMQYLDGLDERSTKIGACNNVYRTHNGELWGTNTDWIGIHGCLLQASPEGRGKPALVIGAGGASRAALYALIDHLDCNTVYIVNRDVEEVRALIGDAQVYGNDINIIHVHSLEQALSLETPYYIVGTVPDFEPHTESELEVRKVIEHILSASTEKGVLLDMCFKPRRTRLLKLGERYGWKTVEGTGIIGHQIEEQYRLWCGDEASRRINKKAAWAVLEEGAASSLAINF